MFETEAHESDRGSDTMNETHPLLANRSLVWRRRRVQLYPLTCPRCETQALRLEFYELFTRVGMYRGQVTKRICPNPKCGWMRHYFTEVAEPAPPPTGSQHQPVAVGLAGRNYLDGGLTILNITGWLLSMKT
jgi:hypothetical protein